MIHQLVKSGRGTGAFQSDVKTDHPQIIHGFPKVLFHGVYNPVGTHFSGQFGPVITDLGSHHIAGSGKTGNSNCHASD